MTYTHTQKVRILYKNILKLHRGLPEELQVLGTNYTRDEFKRHKQCNKKEAEIFMNEWTRYAVTLAQQLHIQRIKTGEKLGVPINPEDIDYLRDEQIAQLYELMKEATKNN